MDLTLVDLILYCVQVAADCLLQWQDECIEWGRGVVPGCSDFNRLMLLRNGNWLMLVFSHCSDQQDCADSDLPFSLPLPGWWSATGWQTRCESLYCFVCQVNEVNSIVRTTSTLYLCSIRVCACSTTILVRHTSLIFPLLSILLSPIYPARISLDNTLLILPLMCTPFLSRNGLGRTMFLRLCSETTSISLNMWRN